MRYATGHICPGLVSFYLGQATGTLSQHLHHAVVGFHQGRNLVISVVYQGLQVVNVAHRHLAAEGGKGPEQTAHHDVSDKAGNEEQQQEDGDNRGYVQDNLAFKVLGKVCERRRHNGYHITAAVEYRSVQGIIAAAAGLFPLHIEALVGVDNIVEGFVVQAVPQNHAVVYLGGGAHDQAAGHVKERDVAAEVVTHAFHGGQGLGGGELLNALYLAQVFLQHTLQGVDAGSHDAVHVCVVALVNEPDTEHGHGHQRDQQGNIYHQADAALEVAPASGVAFSPGNPSNEAEGQDGKEEGLHHIVQPFRLGTGDNDYFLFGDVAHKVTPAFQVYVTAGVLLG